MSSDRYGVLAWVWARSLLPIEGTFLGCGPLWSACVNLGKEVSVLSFLGGRPTAE